MIKSTSLADQVYEKLESEILTGKYPRGSILTEQALCEDLGVSRTPIREALRRLEQTHIIEATAKGMKVLSITKEDALIIFDIRIHVEGLAARACAMHITDEQLAQLREIVELQEFYVTKQDSEKIKSFDSRFHTMIYQFAGSPVYMDTLAPLMSKIQKFRQVSLSAKSRAKESVEEHWMIYKALEKRDPDDAEKAMNFHAQQAKRNIETIVDNK